MKESAKTLINATLLFVILAPVFGQEVGKAAPEISFEHSLNGPSVETITLGSLRGKWVLLDYWATT